MLIISCFLDGIQLGAGQEWERWTVYDRGPVLDVSCIYCGADGYHRATCSFVATPKVELESAK
jgi:hypothetical protein